MNIEIILGVTGSIAVYKACDLAHSITKLGIGVNVVMTKNAAKMIAPEVFEALTSRQAIVDTFQQHREYPIHHIALAKMAKTMIIAPATANIIAKLANGIADDAISTYALACTAPKIVAPAMNTAMLNAPPTQKNISQLRKFGYEIIEPAEGLLACGDVGGGKLPDVDVLCTAVQRAVSKKDLLGKRVLISAGATVEAIDPVRFITNHSSGLMGYSIAKECMLRGAEVILVSGKAVHRPPDFVRVISTFSAEQMYNAIIENSANCDIVIMSAAVADFTPCSYSDFKIKKSGRNSLSLELSATKDILKALGNNKNRKYKLCGFAMETDNLLENAKRKLIEKNCDIIVANSILEEGAGFCVDTNIVTLISNKYVTKLPKMSKAEISQKIVDAITEL